MAIHPPKPETMSIDDVAKMPGCPWQRNTEERVKHAKHLKDFDADHLRMACAQLPDGSRILVDGHSRIALWTTDTGHDPREQRDIHEVLMDVYVCDTMDDVRRLYDRFDSLAAVERSRDRIHGGYRAVNWFPTSHYLTHGKSKTAMERACDCEEDGPTSEDEHFLIEHWLPEIQLFDSCSPRRDQLNAGFYAGALASLRKHGADTEEARQEWDRIGRLSIGEHKHPGNRVRLFWHLYCNFQNDITGDTEVNGVEALQWLLGETRKTKSNRQGESTVTLLQMTLECVEKFVAGEVLPVLSRGRVKIKGLIHRDYIPKRSTSSSEGNSAPPVPMAAKGGE